MTHVDSPIERASFLTHISAEPLDARGDKISGDRVLSEQLHWSLV
jgi:hypothetical protein